MNKTNYLVHQMMKNYTVHNFYRLKKLKDNSCREHTQTRKILCRHLLISNSSLRRFCFNKHSHYLVKAIKKTNRFSSKLPLTKVWINYLTRCSSGKDLLHRYWKNTDLIWPLKYVNQRIVHKDNKTQIQTKIPLKWWEQFHQVFLPLEVG